MQTLPPPVAPARPTITFFPTGHAAIAMRTALAVKITQIALMALSGVGVVYGLYLLVSDGFRLLPFLGVLLVTAFTCAPAYMVSSYISWRVASADASS